MSDPAQRAAPTSDSSRPQTPPVATSTPHATPKADAFLCDRCATEMFRMHAVWRCPNCGFKTDCCGW